VRAEGGAQRLPFPPADAVRRLPAAPAPIQSGSVCVQVASAYVRLDAPITATKISAVLTTPVTGPVIGTSLPE